MATVSRHTQVTSKSSEKQNLHEPDIEVKFVNLVVVVQLFYFSRILTRSVTRESWWLAL